ncbi:MAG: hypothetical protein WKF75_03390 [Singulisphaera sp.]
MISGERKKKVEGWARRSRRSSSWGDEQMVTSSADNLIRIVDDNGSEIRVVARVPDSLQTAGRRPGWSSARRGRRPGAWDGSTGQAWRPRGDEAERRRPRRSGARSPTPGTELCPHPDDVQPRSAALCPGPFSRRVRLGSRGSRARAGRAS